MTPQEEEAVRATWAAKRKMKSYGRIARMKEKEAMKMIAPDHRRWCTRTCRWYDDREAK